MSLRMLIESRSARDPELAAIGLCLSSGYQPIPAYGEYAGNPDRICFEKRLVALVQ
jgi:hypothetical protein